jgi:hypothetical protein
MNEMVGGKDRGLGRRKWMFARSIFRRWRNTKGLVKKKSVWFFLTWC